MFCYWSQNYLYVVNGFPDETTNGTISFEVANMQGPYTRAAVNGFQVWVTNADGSFVSTSTKSVSVWNVGTVDLATVTATNP
jgi:hypothetical protein